MDQTWDCSVQMTAICMACTIFVKLYKVLQIEVVKLAQKVLSVSNFSVMIAKAGSFCHQMGQPVKTSQSDRENVLGKLSVRNLAI